MIELVQRLTYTNSRPFTQVRIDNRAVNIGRNYSKLPAVGSQNENERRVRFEKSRNFHRRINSSLFYHGLGFILSISNTCSFLLEYMVNSLAGDICGRTISVCRLCRKEDYYAVIFFE